MERIRFVRAASTGGWNWLVGIAGHLGAFALILAFLGVSAFYTLKLPQWWYGPLLFFLILVVLFGEGAFRMWRSQATTARLAQQQIDALRESHGTQFSQMGDAHREQLQQTMTRMEAQRSLPLLMHVVANLKTYERGFQDTYKRVSQAQDTDRVERKYAVASQLMNSVRDELREHPDEWNRFQDDMGLLADHPYSDAAHNRKAALDDLQRRTIRIREVIERLEGRIERGQRGEK